MAVHETRGSNGVSYGYIHEVTAADVADNEVIIDFQCGFDLVASVQVYTAAGIVVDTSDMIVTYPEAGQVRIADGAAAFALVAGQRIDIVAQYARGDV